VMIAEALRRRGMTEAAAIATAVVDTVSYYVAFVIALVVAVLLAAVAGHVSALIVGSAVAVATFSVAVVATILVIANGRSPPRAAIRLGVIRRGLAIVRRADPDLVRDRRTNMIAAGLQLGLISLDASTIIALVHAMGADASITGMFASYVIASVFRTLGVLPGGLGSFEAASVLALHAIGVPTTVALSATLVFRGLSFWLPMLPGFVVSNHLAGRHRGSHGSRSGSPP
jgi:P-type Mg2+ transporter